MHGNTAEAERSAENFVPYRVAAVLHTPISVDYNHTVDQMIRDNLRMFDGYLHEAKQQGAELFVLPESSTGFLQVPTQYIHLFCEPLPPLGWMELNEQVCSSVAITRGNGFATASSSFGPHVTWASCRARNFSTYVVIDFCDNETDPTNSSNAVHFNVAAVFAPSGKLVAVYRKSHITGTGPYLTQPSRPDAVTFVANFRHGSVKFGIFICYDFWFFEPMQQEMWAGTRDFLFPNEMGSSNPYYAVVDTAAGWSMRNQVNVVVSTSAGNCGIGLFERGNVVKFVSPQPSHLFANASAVVVGTLRGTRAVPKKSTYHSNNDKSDDRNEQRRRIPRYVRGVRRGARGDDRGEPASSSSSRSRSDRRAAAASGLRREPLLQIANSTCYFGATKLGWLHFPIGCDVVATPQDGQTYTLSASQSSSDGAIAAQCTATFTVASNNMNRTGGHAAATWILAAIALSQPPVVETPSSTATGGCVLVRCKDPSDGCMGSELEDGWTSDLFVTMVNVTGKFSGSNVSSAVRRSGSKLDIYPFVATTNAFEGEARPFPSSFVHIPVSARNVRFTEDAAGTKAAISATSASASELERYQLASAGIWTSMFEAQLKL